MSNEEVYIGHQVGKHNPFRVPEGYFDTLTQQVMARLPEQPVAPVARQRWLRPWLYAAACACVAIFSVTLYFAKPDGQQVATTVTPAVNESSYVDQAFDYAMIDNQDIYACLTSE